MHNGEPLFRIVKRNDTSLKERIIIRAVCVLIAIVLSILFIWIVSGTNPFTAIGIIFSGTFSSILKLKNTMKEVVLLFAIALALIPVFKMKFWNIGAQGQILIGALVSAIIMIYCSSWPNAVLIPVMLVGAIIGGAVWGMIPAIFKAKWGTNETLFTLMMNYIAIKLVGFATENWRGDKSSMGTINMANSKGYFPSIAGNDLIIPLFLVIALMIGMFFYINKSKQGYEVRVVGESVNTAKYAGINVKAVIIRTVLISGAICGVVGFMYVSGFDHTISETTSGGYGFTAIIVCWLSAFNPFIMFFFAFLICFLNKGAVTLKSSHLSPFLNDYSCEFIILVLILFIMASGFFIKYKIVFRKKQTLEVNE